MKNVYRVLAFLVAAGVMVQAAAVAYGFFSLGKFIDGGGTVDKSTKSFPGDLGLEVHGTAGVMVIPVIVLLLLIVSFFAHVPGGVKWALIVLVTTVVQVALGLFAHDVPALGVLHGIVALILFGVAVTTATRVPSATAAQTTSEAPVTVS